MTVLSLAQLEIAKEYLKGRSHGDVAGRLERFLGMSSNTLLDLAVSMNPVAKDYTPLLLRALESSRRYPDPDKAVIALASVLNVDPETVLLCNGGSEAIALVARERPTGYVKDPEFSLYRRHISNYHEQGAWWASNPNNPTGSLLDADELPAVVDEAFYQLATGSWSRRDFENGSYVVGSLTKLFRLPGLRIGYLIAPDVGSARRLGQLQPHWSLNAIAADILPELISDIDLIETASVVASLRGQLVEILRRYGATPSPSSANYVYVEDGLDMFERLLRRGIIVRDTLSFGLPGGLRLAVAAEPDLERIEEALFPTRGARRSKAQGPLMVVGTTSDSGKSTLVAALCRILSDRGIGVAPFKAQNMSLNSAVTATGHEIGRAQARQAYAARIAPEVCMNPVLLKPTSELTSQVVVMGEPLFEINAREFQEKKKELKKIVLGAYHDLASRFDVVLLEGAGSPAEINLLNDDIVNLGLAHSIGAKALLVGDIDRGGVFASLYGTLEILPTHLSQLIRAFAINKLRGDPSLLDKGVRQLELMTNRSTLAVLPYFDESMIDSEDSLSFASMGQTQASDLGALDVCVVALPRMSNFTDFDPLFHEAMCNVRFVNSPGQLGYPDLVVIPGSKSTVGDLHWLRVAGFVDAILGAARRGSVVLGICGGYQMLGTHIVDRYESKVGSVEGLGLLDVQTEFLASKVTLMREGTSPVFQGTYVSGYQIHQGRVRVDSGEELFHLHMPNTALDRVSGSDGAVDSSGLIFGTTLHGIFEGDAFRRTFLSRVADVRSKSFMSTISFCELREQQTVQLAKFVETHMNVDELLRCMKVLR